jgi:serine protease Do
MSMLGNRVFAALTIILAGAAFTAVGVALSNADESKAPDLADLREAVNAAAKRGENVGEIRRALDALEKSLAKGWTAPASGKTVDPPSELVVLRETVEAAARKGENVEEIRKQLDIVEKTLTGKVLVKPKLLPPVVPPQPEPPPQDNPFRGPVGPGNFPIQPRLPQQIIPGGVIDAEGIQKAQDMMRRAAEMLLRNPDDPEALKLMQQAQDMLLKAMIDGRGGMRGVDPGMIVPGFGGRIPEFGGRVPEKFRLGVRLERVSELAADQLGLDVARGVGIVAVVEGSAAEKAGFKTHDIVLEFGGKPVTDNPEDFTRQVAEVRAGEKVDATVMRKGKKIEIKGIDMPDVPRANARPLPFEGLPNRPELNQGPKPGGRIAIDGDRRLQGANSESYSVINGQLTIRASLDGVTYVILGQRDGNETEVNRITITDGDKKIEVEKVEKVPEQYRPIVEKLLKGGQGRSIRP